MCPASSSIRAHTGSSLYQNKLPPPPQDSGNPSPLKGARLMTAAPCPASVLSAPSDSMWDGLGHAAAANSQIHAEISGTPQDQRACCPHCFHGAQWPRLTHRAKGTAVCAAPAKARRGRTAAGVDGRLLAWTDGRLLQLWLLLSPIAWESGHTNPSCMGRKRGHKAKSISTRLSPQPHPQFPARSLCHHD